MEHVGVEEIALVGGGYGAVVSDAGDGVFFARFVASVGIVEGRAHEVVWFFRSTVVVVIEILITMRLWCCCGAKIKDLCLLLVRAWSDGDEASGVTSDLCSP